MEHVLVLTHCDETGAALTKGSLEAVTAGVQLAARLNAELTIGIVGRDAESAAKAVGATGAKLLLALGEAFAVSRFASDAAACEAIVRAAEPAFVLAPHSSRFARVMAAVAHRVGGFIDTHVAAVGGESDLEATRWYYRQRIEAVLTRSARPWFLLLDPGAHPACAGGAAPAQCNAITAALPPLRTTVIGTRSPHQGTGASAAGTIRPEAELLFVAGAGWTKKQSDGQVHAAKAGELILQFLNASRASLGSSKSLVDQGGDGTPVLPFLTHLNQVGQTGSTPRHRKGLATCCHGEEPHVVGWRFIDERRAINLDPNCNWTRGKADVVYVSDAFQVIAHVNALLA